MEETWAGEGAGWRELERSARFSKWKRCKWEQGPRTENSGYCKNKQTKNLQKIPTLELNLQKLLEICTFLCILVLKSASV